MRFVILTISLLCCWPKSLAADTGRQEFAALTSATEQAMNSLLEQTFSQSTMAPHVVIQVSNEPPVLHQTLGAIEQAYRLSNKKKVLGGGTITFAIGAGSYAASRYTQAIVTRNSVARSTNLELDEGLVRVNELVRDLARLRGLSEAKLAPQVTRFAQQRIASILKVNPDLRWVTKAPTLGNGTIVFGTEEAREAIVRRVFLQELNQALKEYAEKKTSTSPLLEAPARDLPAITDEIGEMTKLPHRGNEIYLLLRHSDQFPPYPYHPHNIRGVNQHGRYISLESFVSYLEGDWLHPNPSTPLGPTIQKFRAELLEQFPVFQRIDGRLLSARPDSRYLPLVQEVENVARRHSRYNPATLAFPPSTEIVELAAQIRDTPSVHTPPWISDLLNPHVQTVAAGGFAMATAWVLIGSHWGTQEITALLSDHRVQAVHPWSTDTKSIRTDVANWLLEQADERIRNHDNSPITYTISPRLLTAAVLYRTSHRIPIADVPALPNPTK